MSQDNSNIGPGATQDGPAAAAGLAQPARRRLLRAGAAATPVLLSLASSPVSATTAGCTVASSFVSVATFKSRNPSATVSCGYKNCEYWRDQSGYPGHSQGQNCGNSNLNGTVGSLLGNVSGCSYNGWKLCDVMGQTITTSSQLGVLQHIISLCLDSMTSNMAAPNGINQTYLQGVWSSYFRTGTYTAPNSGLVWNESQIIAWLRTMLGYPIP